MLKELYTSIKNYNLSNCKKLHCESEKPTLLLKENFLSEFKTDLDKRKVLANLDLENFIANADLNYSTHNIRLRNYQSIQNFDNLLLSNDDTLNIALCKLESRLNKGSSNLQSNSLKNIEGFNYYFGENLTYSSDISGNYVSPIEESIDAFIIRSQHRYSSEEIKYRDLILDINSDKIWSRRITLNEPPSIQQIAFISDLENAGINTNVITYKGTLGEGGTISSIPSSDYKIGHMYIIITEGQYLNQNCNKNDIIIAIQDSKSEQFQIRDWLLIKNNIPVFKGASNSSQGTSGLVPAPTIGDRDKYLKGDGTWAEINTQSSGSYTLPVAEHDVLGGLKPIYNNTQVVKYTFLEKLNEPIEIQRRSNTPNRFYAVESDASGIPYVNVPWTNNDLSEYIGEDGCLYSNNARTISNYKWLCEFNQLYTESNTTYPVLLNSMSGNNIPNIGDIIQIDFKYGSNIQQYDPQIFVTLGLGVSINLKNITYNIKFEHNDTDFDYFTLYPYKNTMFFKVINISDNNIVLSLIYNSYYGSMSRYSFMSFNSKSAETAENSNSADTSRLSLSSHFANFARSVYCECDTEPSTSEKIASSQNTYFKLQPGVVAYVKFNKQNSATSITLNVNETGAKNIKYLNNIYGSEYSGRSYVNWTQYQVVQFIYNDKDQWEIVGLIDLKSSDSTVS